MLQSLDPHRRNVRDVLGLAPHAVTLEHGDDLVVRLAAVDELRSAITRAATRISDFAIGRSLIVFGGYQGDNVADTWELIGGQWRRVE